MPTSTNGSISVFAQLAVLTSGGMCFTGFWKDQCLRPSSMSIIRLPPPAFATVCSRGSGAPISIHFLKFAITSSGSFCFGGICMSSFFQVIASYRLLCAMLPGVTPGCPDSPPSSVACFVSSVSPPFTFSDSLEWHL